MPVSARSPPQGYGASRASDGRWLTGPSFDVWLHCATLKLTRRSAEVAF